MASELTTPVTPPVKGSTKPVALFVSLQTEPEDQGSRVEQEFSKLKKILSDATSRFSIRTLPDASPTELQEALETYRERIELIYFVARAERIDDLALQIDYVSGLFELLQAASPRIVFANGFGGPALAEFAKLAEKDPFDCYITLEQTPPHLSAVLVEGFFRKLAMGMTARRAFEEVDSDAKEHEKKANLPWNINGQRTNFRLVRKAKGFVRRSPTSYVFGRPEFPKPAVALLIQAAADDDLHHSKLEIDEIEDALNGTEHCKPIPIKNATIESVIAGLEKYGEQIDIIHFAGHANGQTIQLRSENQDKIKPIYMSGLADDFSKVKPRLIFINGCSSDQQATELMQRPDQAWSIMTDAEIDDNRACELAKHFYLQIAKGKTVEQAFKSAKEIVERRIGRNTNNPEEQAYRAIDLEDDEIPVQRNRFPWRIFPNSESWQLGMTQLERIENKGGPGWRLTDMKFGNSNASRFWAIGLLVTCFFVGVFAWSLALKRPESHLAKHEWVKVKKAEPISVDLDNEHFNVRDSKTGEQSFHSLGSDLWHINRIIQRDDRVVKGVDVKMRRKSTRNVAKVFGAKNLNFRQAPSVHWSRILLLLVGLTAAITLFRLLIRFGCWHVRLFDHGAARNEDAGIGRKIKLFAKKIYRGINEERQGTAIGIFCLFTLAPLVVLPVYDFFHRTNHVTSQVERIELDGLKDDPNSASWELEKLPETFHNLKKLVFRNTEFTPTLIEQLAEFENDFDTKPEFDVGLELPFLDSDGVLMSNQNVFRSYAAQLPKNSRVKKFLESEKGKKLDRLNEFYAARPSSNTKKTLKDYITYPEDSRNKLVVTISEWPFKVDKSEEEDSDSNDQDLESHFDAFFRQASRFDLQIKIKEDLVEKESFEQVLQKIVGIQGLRERLTGLDVSGNLLTQDAIEQIRKFKNLGSLVINECRIDRSGLQSLLLGIDDPFSEPGLEFFGDSQSISIGGSLTQSQHERVFEFIQTICGTVEVFDQTEVVSQPSVEPGLSAVEPNVRKVIANCQDHLLIWELTVFRGQLHLSGVAKSATDLEQFKSATIQDLENQYKIFLPANVPLKKLTRLDCNHNLVSSDDLKLITKWRIQRFKDEMDSLEKKKSNEMASATLAKLTSDAWANTQNDNVEQVFQKFKTRKVYKVIEKARSNQTLYGNMRIQYFPSDISGATSNNFAEGTIQIHPRKVKITKESAIPLLRFLNGVEQLELNFGGKYSVSAVNELAQLNMSVNNLHFDGIQKSVDFLNVLFESPLVAKSDRLTLRGLDDELTDKHIVLPFGSLNESRLRTFDFEGPACILGVTTLKKDLDLLMVECAKNADLTRHQKTLCDFRNSQMNQALVLTEFLMGTAELTQLPQEFVVPPPKPRIKKIKMQNVILHQFELENLLGYSPQEMNLANCEWDNTRKTNLDQFRKMFELSDSRNDMQLVLPYQKCVNDPKREMPILTFQEFAQLPYFKKLIDQDPYRYLVATRTYRTRFNNRTGKQKKEGFLFLLGNQNDIEKTLNLFVAACEKSGDLPIQELSIKVTEENPVKLSQVFQAISKKLGPFGRKLRKISVKGSEVGDELPRNLKLYCKLYDFQGCPKVTPDGIYDLAIFCQGCNLDIPSFTVMLDGGMGIGEISERLTNNDHAAKFKNFSLNYSKALITKTEQSELTRINVFSSQSIWISGRYKRFEEWKKSKEKNTAVKQDHKKLWELVKMIELYLASSNPRERERALILAGARLDEHGSPNLSVKTEFESTLRETQVMSGYWPLILEVKAAIAAARKDYVTAIDFIEQARDLSVVIMKSYWTAETNVAQKRKEYREQFEQKLKRYELKQKQLQTKTF